MQSDPDVAMDDAQPTSPAGDPANVSPGAEDPSAEDTTAKNHDNAIVNFIDALGRVSQSLASPVRHPLIVTR